MLVKKIESRPELMDAIKILKEDADRATKKVLADCDMMFFRKVSIWIGYENDELVTLNATHFGKRKSSIWEPYSNYYIAVTKMSQRRQGYARALNSMIQREAVAAGCVRVKALDGTKLGVLFSEGLGYQAWGLTDKNELIIDHPLVDIEWPTDKIPKTARKWTDRLTPLNQQEIQIILETTRFPYDD